MEAYFLALLKSGLTVLIIGHSSDFSAVNAGVTFRFPVESVHLMDDGDNYKVYWYVWHVLT